MLAIRFIFKQFLNSIFAAYWGPPKNKSKSRNSRRTRWFDSPIKWYVQNMSFGYVPGYVGEMNTSDLFLCGVIVKEHGEPVIGVPISNIAIIWQEKNYWKIRKVKNSDWLVQSINLLFKNFFWVKLTRIYEWIMASKQFSGCGILTCIEW